MKKDYLKNFEFVSTWKKKKRKNSNFVDAGSNNWNERRELTTWSGSKERSGEKKNFRRNSVYK